jgi:hypothetical protein
MDNWDTGPFADLMQPRARLCEDTVTMDATAETEPGSGIFEWWANPDDHSIQIDPGFYSFFETLFPSTEINPFCDKAVSGSGSVTVELLDGDGAVLSAVTISVEVTVDAGPPGTYEFTAGDVDLSGNVPVSAFNGVRITNNLPHEWPDSGGSLVYLAGRKRVTIEGAAT